MYNVFKEVITLGKFDLTDILKKIDNQWIKNNITEEQKIELIKMAQDNASVDQSIQIFEKLKDFEKRLQKIEAGLTTPSVPEAGDLYEPYEEGKWYYNGNKVSFEGKNYQCIAPEGTVCVWSPKNYPVYWELV